MVSSAAKAVYLHKHGGDALNANVGSIDTVLSPVGVSNRETDYYDVEEKNRTSRDQMPMIFTDTVRQFLDYDRIGFVELTLAILAFFFFAGYMWSVFFERTGIGAYLQARNIAAAFSIMDLVIAFVYRDQLASAVQDFIATPTRYVNIVLSLRDLGWDIAGMLSARSDSECELCKKQINELYDVMKAINYLLLRMFIVEDRTTRTYDDDFEHVIVKFTSNVRSPSANLRICNVELLRRISLMAHQGTFRDSEETTIYNQLHELTLALRAVDQSSMVVQPTILYNQLLLAVAIYSLINNLTPLMLPVIMYLFLGAIIYRWWLGDPFDADPRGDRFNYDMIRIQTKLELEAANRYALYRDDINYESDSFQTIDCIHKERKLGLYSQGS
jgi:hypothetical protein